MKAHETQSAHAVPSRRGIGLLGGTFDPIHNGHLALAQAALDALGLSCVEFLPAGEPWQKRLLTPSIHRLEMTRAALCGEPLMRVNDMEIRRSGPTYTVETLSALRGRLGGSYPLVLLLGGDQWRNLHTWSRWQSLLDYANIAVCARAGAAIDADQAVLEWSRNRRVEAGELTAHDFGRIAFFSMPSHLASATAIRSAFARWPFPEAMRRIEGWLPFEVSAYIRRNALYGTGRRTGS